MSRVALALLALFAALHCRAQYPLTQALDVRAGQQRPSITSIAQDGVGMIWAVSDRGLLRLDGERVDVELSTAPAHITGIAAADTGVPPSGKLSDCDIRKILLWVDAGAQNN